MIKIGSQFNLHKNLGFCWSGWMGGQWAMTPEILSYVEGRTLTTLCGGPGDLGLNAVLAGVSPGAINVDASRRAIDYGTKIAGVYDTGTVDEEFDATVQAIIQINSRDTGVPAELITPHFTVGQPMAGLGGKIFHVHADALEYLRNRPVSPQPGINFFYLATPTVLPDGVLSGGKKHFYQLYDPDIEREIGVTWADSKSEWDYLGNMIDEIARIDPRARIGFGVGEGDTSIAAYVELFEQFGTIAVVMEKAFCGDGYTFTDWLITCDLGAK